MRNLSLDDFVIPGEEIGKAIDACLAMEEPWMILHYEVEHLMEDGGQYFPSMAIREYIKVIYAGSL